MSNRNRSGLRGCGLQTLRDIQLDGTVAGLEVLNCRREMKAEPLRCVVREDNTIIKLERLVQDIAEEIRIHAEVDDHFVRGLCDSTDIRVTGLQSGGVDGRGGWFGGFAHIKMKGAEN